ncbi:hypothetical protein M0805_004127 [Coniferiporia weirii]|nr:hypothetical protein M0805_004127 [Coniferiporia weirii]
MVFQSAPSSKALGKRPVRGVAAATSPPSIFTPSGGSSAVDDEAEDYSAPPSTTGSVQTRTNQKRVLPTRARRGGPGAGIGANEIDLSILDLLKRKGENDPLIPSKTVFILTTDSKFVPSASTSELGLNHYANERYFDRPEVIKAYKEQRDIQVPEFTQLTEEEMVGGRLRARSGEVETADLSDAAYEKRHRKYEMLEKRQRLREKEKLQHEHYKLKERIDQLRTMDYNAFHVLSADVFGRVDTPVDDESMFVTGVGANGAISLHEGERRRRMMLEAALSLEKRYRTLLPPGRGEVDRYVNRVAADLSEEPSTVDGDIEEDIVEAELDTIDGLVSGRSKPIKLKLKLRPPTVPSTPSAVTVAPRSGRRRRGVSISQDILPSSPGVTQGESYRTAVASHEAPTPRVRPGTVRRLPSPTPDLIYQLDHDPAVTDTLPNASQTTSNYSDPTYVEASDRNIEHLALVRQSPVTSYANIGFSNPSYGFPHQTAPRIELQLHHLSPEDFEAPRKRPRTQSNGDHAAAVVEYAATEQDSIDDMPAYSPVLPVRPELPVPPMSSSMPGPMQPESATISVQIECSWPSAQPGPLPVSLTQTGPDALPATQESQVRSPTEKKATGPMGQHLAAIPEQEDSPALRRRTINMPSRRRESTAPVISVASAASATPSVSSLQAYDIPSGPGRHRPPPCILVVSKHNIAPGRKTGRSVKAFGTEVPAFDEKEVDFELPYDLLEEVEALRAGPVDFDYNESEDGDLVHSLINGDQPADGTFLESSNGSNHEDMVEGLLQ